MAYFLCISQTRKMIVRLLLSLFMKWRKFDVNVLFSRFVFIYKIKVGNRYSCRNVTANNVVIVMVYENEHKYFVDECGEQRMKHVLGYGPFIKLMWASRQDRFIRRHFGVSLLYKVQKQQHFSAGEIGCFGIFTHFKVNCN